MNQRHAFSFFLAAVAVVSATTASAANCESLAGLKLLQTTITAATTLAAGDFLPPGDPPAGPTLTAYRSMPSFCRVQGVIAPSNDSHIEFEVWLPVPSFWNGRYLGIGNGGLAGSIRYADRPNNPGLTSALTAGYATSSTDTGHKGTGTDGSWAIGHPERVIDYGYRAIHETAAKAKVIIASYYGSEANKSYFSSCSDGGRQALMEAQRFPADYDGIIAGAPNYAWTDILAAFNTNMQATEADPESYIPAVKLPAIEAGALRSCDALDGVKDGVIDDPTRCHFDPASLLCEDAESNSCLTSPQITALQKIYAGLRTSQGEQVFPGYLPGGETGAAGWERWITGSTTGSGLQFVFASQTGAFLYQSPDWDFRTFSLERDGKAATEKLGPILDAKDANLQVFKDRGGKLILYHGWSDAAIPPMNTVNYHQSVSSKMGPESVNDFVRLYMVPGMQHCDSGPGTDSFGARPGLQDDTEHSILKSLERWVEQGLPPDRIIATKYKTGGGPPSGVLRTRPLCPYPQVGKYQGSGSADDDANFACTSP